MDGDTLRHDCGQLVSLTPKLISKVAKINKKNQKILRKLMKKQCVKNA